MADEHSSPDGKTINSMWRLHDHYTVTDAACLLAGIPPETVATLNSEADDQSSWRSPDVAHPRYYMARQGLVNAITAGTLPATIRTRLVDGWQSEIDPAPTETDWAASTVTRDDLIAWLKVRGIKDGFFVTASPDLPGYLNPQDHRYAPKLAAAVSAWLAVTDGAGKHPKQALEKWLREHAAAFGLTDADGNPQTGVVEEVAKIANWRPGGGTPKSSGD